VPPTAQVSSTPPVQQTVPPTGQVSTTPPVQQTLPPTGQVSSTPPAQQTVPPTGQPVVPVTGQVLKNGGAPLVETVPQVPLPVPAQPPQPVVQQPAVQPQIPDASLGDLGDANLSALRQSESQLRDVRSTMDSLAVEVQKKFALSIACIVFVLFGPPIALRFPRGGVGATLGVSLIVFGLYYVCLMAGETLADDGKLPPWVAMWGANAIFTTVGLLLLVSIESTADATRSGGIAGWISDRRARKALRRARIAMPAPSAAM
jgi:lipopolysaccharide export system permease protein